MAVAEAGMPAWTRRPGVRAAFHAVIFLHYGMMWVAVAGCLAFDVGRRFFGAVEGSPVLSAACSVIRNSLLVGVMFFPAAAMLVPFRGMLSVHKKDNKDPLTLVVIGGLVLVAFMMLIAAADFVVGQSHLKGSRKAHGDSVLRELGLLGVAVVYHFIILPSMAPKQRMMK